MKLVRVQLNIEAYSGGLPSFSASRLSDCRNFERKTSATSSDPNEFLSALKSNKRNSSIITRTEFNDLLEIAA